MEDDKEDGSIKTPGGWKVPSDTYYDMELTVSEPDPDAECETEDSEIEGFTGSGVSWAVPSTVHSSGGMISPGTHTSPWLPSTTATTVVPEIPPVSLPEKFSRKAVMAFLDPDNPGDDEVMWAAILEVMDTQIIWEDGELTMTVKFNMRDRYDNASK